MFKRLRAIRRRFDEHRRYLRLVARLEGINAADVGELGGAAPKGVGMRQGDGRR